MTIIHVKGLKLQFDLPSGTNEDDMVREADRVVSEINQQIGGSMPEQPQISGIITRSMVRSEYR